MPIRFRPVGSLLPILYAHTHRFEACNTTHSLHKSAMKLIISPLLALLALVAFVSAATDFQNAVTCGKRFPRINQAIEIFCKKQKDGKLANDLTIPSKYATEGVGTTNIRGKKILVAISGNCAPPQWIPHNWCMAQFQEMCATTLNKDTGYNWRNYGRGNCQQWKIEPRHENAVTRSARGPFQLVGMPKLNLPKIKAGGGKILRKPNKHLPARPTGK